MTKSQSTIVLTVGDARRTCRSAAAIRLHRAGEVRYYVLHAPVSVEAQLMANCRHGSSTDYQASDSDDGCPPVRRLLRWAVATLAAAALWVSGVCGPRDELPSAIGQLMAGCRVIQFDDTEYDRCPPVRRLLRRVSGKPTWAIAVEHGRRG